MCHNGTKRRLGATAAAGIWLASLGVAQTPDPQPDWRRIGSPAVELQLASPATGSVSGVWFAPGGNRLFVLTRSGTVFQTDDFDTWAPAAAPPYGAGLAAAPVVRLPEAGARVVAAPGDPARVYALGRHLYRSEDGGRSWTNLTAFRADSVVGNGQRGLAISPVDSDQLVVANDFGVWRSLDGGLSWSGLNQGLPNLPVRRILGTPSGTAGARIRADGLGGLELPQGGGVWTPVADTDLAREAAARRAWSAATGVEIVSFAAAGETVYAGSADGRIWVSFDGGRAFRPSRQETGGAVERIFVDTAEPRVALAALAGPGARVLRTTNAGGFWDDLTANLPEGAAHAVTADRAANAVYVATDRGVFYARADLANASAPAAQWAPITARLPGAAMDVRLDAAGYQLYVAIDGYGVYAAQAPHRARAFRIVNAADFSTRPAAPGSLLSVVGGRVESASSAGINYPVLAASDSDTQIQVPFEVSGPSLDLALRTRTGSISLPLAVQPVSPAIFVGRDGAPMILDADSELLLDGRNPARSNTRIQILATGLGKVRPDWPTGLAAPLEGAPEVIAPVRAFLDRTPVTVTRASLAPGYIGLYLVEVQLPAVVNAGPAELYLAAGGQESNRVALLVER